MVDEEKDSTGDGDSFQDETPPASEETPLESNDDEESDSALAEDNESDDDADEEPSEEADAPSLSITIKAFSGSVPVCKLETGTVFKSGKKLYEIDGVAGGLVTCVELSKAKIQVSRDPDVFEDIFNKVSRETVSPDAEVLEI